MFIKKIYIKNIKSFKEQEIELKNFNVLIGANASGKSNFVQIFEFLKSLNEEGLENAVSLQGGFEYLKNLMLKDSEEIQIRLNGLTSNMSRGWWWIFINSQKSEYQILDNSEVLYEIKFSNENNKLIFYEKIVLEIKIVEKKIINKIEKPYNYDNYTSIKITLENESGKIKPPSVESSNNNKFNPDNIKNGFNKMFSIFFEEEHKDISVKLILKMIELIDKPLFNISKYDFDPKVIKNPVPNKTKLKLEEDGNNLTIKLKNLLKSEIDKQKLFNLINYVLPFIKGFEFEYPTTRSIALKLGETFSPGNYLPASLISDGTINVIALIIALYFENDAIQIFEEPERNIHPILISKVVEMMKDASRKKQLIITTHNPEIVKYSGLENLLLIARTKEGFSKITRPVDKEEVKIFLENQIGLDELFVQNLLEI